MNQQERSAQEHELGIASGYPGAIAALIKHEANAGQTFTPQARIAFVQAALAEAERASIQASNRYQLIESEANSLNRDCTECGTTRPVASPPLVTGGLCEPCRKIQAGGIVVVREHLDAADAPALDNTMCVCGCTENGHIPEPGAEVGRCWKHSSCQKFYPTTKLDELAQNLTELKGDATKAAAVVREDAKAAEYDPERPPIMERFSDAPKLGD